MPQGGLLGPPADLVDHDVGQPDGVEVVHHHGGVPKWVGQRAGIATPWIQCDRGDRGQPGWRPGAEPAAHRGPGAVGHQVQQPATLQVHQAGDPPGGRDAGRLEEARLVQPQRGDTGKALRVIHQRTAVIAHRPHHRRPADSEVAGDRRHRVGVLADPPARFGPGPLGQHHPRADRGDPLGPGAHPAGGLTTAPDALAPPQHHRTATSGQVAHPGGPAAMGLGPNATPDAADHRGRRLDGELPLAACDLRGEDLKAVKAEQPGRRRTTLMTHLRPSRLADIRHPQAMRGPRCCSGGLHRRQQHTAPTFRDEEPVKPR
jgi:hypothetical protein